jgi:tetratricopeptide (TPR) repeat protein
MASTYAPSRWIQTTDPADLERCIEFAMRAIEANPELPGAHVALGYAYWRQGRLKDAIEEEETAARLDPDSFGDYFLGGCYSELGQYEEAAAASRRFHERVETPFNLHLLGFELMQLDRGVEARWALREGHRLALTPGGYQWQGVLTSLAEQLRREGDVARARASAMESLAWLERSDNIFRGTLRVQTLAGLGRTCLDEGDHRGAGAAFEQALALMEASPSGLGMGHLKVVCTAGLARVRRDAAMFERAVEFFEVRPSMNFGFLPVGCDVSTTCDLAHAASQFNEAGLAREYARRSEQLGMPVHLLP